MFLILNYKLYQFELDFSSSPLPLHQFTRVFWTLHGEYHSAILTFHSEVKTCPAQLTFRELFVLFPCYLYSKIIRVWSYNSVIIIEEMGICLVMTPSTPLW